MITITEFPILYKYTAKGQIQQWQIFAQDDSFYTEEGIKDGKITRSKPTITSGKNIGRSNETTPEEQAIAEATAKWTKKINEGYNEVLTQGDKFFKPMLAENIDDFKDLLFTRRTFIQPKLDGLRCINQGNKLMSRNGKPFITCPHLTQSEVILDGELYNHDFKDDFNAIVSLIKRTKITEKHLKHTEEFAEHWVYDFPTHVGVFSERYEALQKWVKQSKNEKIKIVPTYEVKSMEDIDKYHEQFLAEGFEGSIIRVDLASYENKRSRQLLKKKDFMDSEYKIVAVIPGEGDRTGTVGKFTLEMEDGTKFDSNVKGNHKYLAQLLKNADDLIGKSATVKHFKFTPAGIPRFPYVIKIGRELFE